MWAKADPNTTAPVSFNISHDKESGLSRFSERPPVNNKMKNHTDYGGGGGGGGASPVGGAPHSFTSSESVRFMGCDGS